MGFQICILMLLLAASVTDIRKREIPLWEIAAAAVISLVAAGLKVYGKETDIAGIALSLLPGVGLILISLATSQGIGMGDGLMLLAIGPALGLYRTGLGMLLAFFVSSLFSLALIILKKAGRKTRIPFIPFMTIGTGVAIFAAL